jgi:hypothetical protein
MSCPGPRCNTCYVDWGNTVEEESDDFVGARLKDERRTSNVQHRMMNEKDKENETDVKCLELEVCFSFDVGRWTFDVRRSSFKPRPYSFFL